MNTLLVFLGGAAVGGTFIGFWSSKIKPWIKGEVTVLTSDGKVAVTGAAEHVKEYFADIAAKVRKAI